jgi:hypothetical protein
MVRTVVAEFQFECLAAEREAANLVTEADSEDWNFADELADILYCVLVGSGSPGPLERNTPPIFLLKSSRARLQLRSGDRSEAAECSA